MNMSSYVAEFYIDSKTLDWVTTESCPSIFNKYVADILVDALGINGSANVFCKCKNEELLNALKGKIIDYELRVRKE